ncbi:Mn2+/Fe2+ NRAMP family transporter [Nonlabens dokdonensis]|uniref:Mn2 and Fe2 transporter of the NRAMP family n=2 Tax=Nonlabens dokdonensis TaxID=328515 RepID=L7WA16_NONDD|nr:divalent metal cation transporter [Nonlabens dokdonensis]AGC75718.1 Mn2 and Fe2 transporter of the NRAMP family [Nonlabens dokdonensis DSW-6]PZX43405.1 Mn2+/Fe2+ NRAMP family transporter [Nonlabens dokdonensis]
MNKFFKVLGPGLLFASTAIGVSHLVQSTRAGMIYGYGFLGAIIIINILKYPFFEYGTRYAAGSNESLIDGYKRLGKWAIWSYFVVMIVSLFFVSAAVFQVTAVFMKELFQIEDVVYTFLPLVLIIGSCFMILALGKYKFLDQFIKVVGLAMIVCVLIAFIMTFFKEETVISEQFEAPQLWSLSTIPFGIALMGWMPTAVDLSAWNSLWTLEKQKVSGYRSTVKESTNEFALGYGISAVLAVLFLALGSMLVYGTDTVIVSGSAGFANQVIALFTSAMGEWSYYIIAIAAFCIMYGTSIGVLDGYSRALKRTTEVLFFKSKTASEKWYLSALVVTALGGFSICYFLSNNPKGFLLLVDIATILSFLFAPIVAVLNYKLVTRMEFPKEHHPRFFMKAISLLGITVLTVMSLVYICYYCGAFN